jgi:hypothetical protein
MVWLPRACIIFLALGALAACKPYGWASPLSAAQHGRYLGVGLYSPGKQWTHLVANQKPGSDAVARPIDDQVIFVVADSQTGELRACGDLTGYCIGMNPWTKPLLASQVSPIELTEHVQSPDTTADYEAAPAVRRRPYRPASSLRAPPAGGPARF